MKPVEEIAMPSLDESLKRKIEDSLPSLAGWCHIDKACCLAKMIVEGKPKKVLEIGVFGGQSLIPMAMALKHISSGNESFVRTAYGIDPWTTEACLEEMVEPANKKWWSALNIGEIHMGCVAAIKRLGLADVCQLIQAKAEDAAVLFRDGEIGLLHIDGNHSEAVSFKDAVAWLPKVAAGGIIALDDASWHENGVNTTRKALQHLLDNGCEKIDAVGDCVILRKT